MLVEIDDALRQADRRQPGGRPVPSRVTAAREEAQVADQDHPDDRDERARDLLVDPGGAEDDHPHRDRHGQGRDARLGDVLDASSRTSGGSCPLPSLTPSTPCSWPIATWMPTPVRNPIRTLRDRKLAMKPSFRTRAASSTTATIRAARPARATYSGRTRRPRPSRPVRPPARPPSPSRPRRPGGATSRRRRTGRAGGRGCTAR